MLDPIRLSLAVLAVYRIAELIAIDDGPMDVFVRFRRAFGRRAASSSVWRNAAELIHCPFCLGVWISALILPLVYWPTTAGDLFLTWMAITGGQAVLAGFSVRDEDDGG